MLRLFSTHPEKKKNDYMEIMLKCWLQNFTVCSEVLFYFLGWENSEIKKKLFFVSVCLFYFVVVSFCFPYKIVSLGLLCYEERKYEFNDSHCIGKHSN